ncbi:MAG: 1-deoxy-D-xylulose-5-phosphate reductoisomerase, partial [Spirochaetaceae bacterium]|nr:1-deoxy-D-xylulose-5-phosphate reductoisomerase [Spirochaetaceae bacterium]
MVKKILVLGATGSIGTQTLDVVRRFPDRLQVVGMTTHRHNQELAKFGVEFGCGKLLITGRFPTAMRTELLREFIAESGADLAVNGVAGAAGLMPSVFALESGMDLALA